MSITTKPTYSASKQKVEPFARFKGTSAWHQYRNRAHAYARYKAALARASQHRASPEV